MKHQPLITIVTVSYNAVTTIEETILSVINQTYTNIEYIIIDGGSTDGTVDIIKKYENRISYWVSEPDKGIYDAMNKGIQKASGEYSQFLNAGDTIFSNNTIQDIITKLPQYSNDVIYGDIAIKKKMGLYHFVPLPLNTFKHRFPIYHPSSWVKSQILKKYQFDTSFKIAADFNFFRIIYYGNKTFHYIPIIFTLFEGETGISSTNYKQLWLEKQIITKAPYLQLKKIAFNIRYKVKRPIKKVINFINSDYIKNRDAQIFLKDLRIKSIITQSNELHQ